MNIREAALRDEEPPPLYDFAVKFPVSPSGEDTFFVAKGGTPTGSGPVRYDVAVGGSYTYDITSLSLAKSADPAVNVKP